MIIAVDKGTTYTKSSGLISFKSTVREYQTDEMNYTELKEELKPYELEDLLNLKEFESLNLIKTKDGYARFITKLPPPII